MRKICYGVARSLDGYIAGPNGEDDWIVTDPEIDFGAMFAKYDTLLMGRKTFKRMTKAGNAPMPGRKIVVFSKTLRGTDFPDVTIVAERLEQVVRDLRLASGKDIWLFGGGSLFHTFLDKGLVDTIEVGLIPALLGGNCTAARSGQTREPDIVGLALIQKQRRIDADLRIEIG